MLFFTWISPSVWLRWLLKCLCQPNKGRAASPGQGKQSLQLLQSALLLKNLLQSCSSPSPGGQGLNRRAQDERPHFLRAGMHWGAHYANHGTQWGISGKSGQSFLSPVVILAQMCTLGLLLWVHLSLF